MQRVLEECQCQKKGIRVLALGRIRRKGLGLGTQCDGTQTKLLALCDF